MWAMWGFPMSKTGADQGTKQALLYSIFRSIRQIFPVMISIFFCMGVFVFSNVSVSAKEQETVKVGYYFSHNFQEGTDDTSPKSGYGYEYLQKLASYTGWKYEYIYGEWNDLFEKLKNGMNKTKTSFDEKINNVFSNFRKVDEEFLDELEEVLIMSDIGMDTSIKIISNLRERMKKEKIQDEEDVKQALREEMQKILDVTDINLHLNTKPSVILVVGVNGVGKTTSIGKMANRLAKDGKKVVVAAADTFRAAAVEQLEIWANRAGATVVKRDEGVDPASVVYDAIKQTKELGADILIVDTAGRLHNKKYLMDELNKIQKVINKEMADADKEVLLVIDGTTGQNAISQVKAFKQEADITGIVLTKLDGTAKGGVVIGIVEENQIPVKFIGVGEQIDDMEIFNSEDFVKAII